MRAVRKNISKGKDGKKIRWDYLINFRNKNVPIKEKIFEDYFTEIQADMVSICLEYVENKADKIYLYASFESNVMTPNYFYDIGGTILNKHKLNDANNITDQCQQK